MILPNNLAHYVQQPTTPLFASRNDPSDRRVGDIIQDPLPSDNRPVVVLLGVPQDLGVARNGGRVGAAQAPDTIRRALYKYTPYTGSGALTDTIALHDLGNIAVAGLELEEVHERQQHVVAFLVAEGCIPVVLGGGHDIAWPDIAGFGSAHNEIGVVNIDPHTDVRPLLEGGKAHSGSPFRQMIESDKVHVPLGAFVEFGIQRFAVAQAHAEYVIEKGMAIQWYHDIRQQGFLAAFQAACQQATGGTRPLFVSFDMDAVCSADAPGVSATAPIGFSGEEMCAAAEYAGSLSLTGMIDIAEVNPVHDSDGRTAKLAALGVMHFLAGVAGRNRGS